MLAKPSKDALGWRARGPDRNRVSVVGPPPHSTRLAGRAAPHPSSPAPSRSGRRSPAPRPRRQRPAGDLPADGAPAAATRKLKPLQSLLRVSPSRAAVPRRELLSGSLPRPPPPGRSRQRCSTGGARAAPCAQGGESPPHWARRGAGCLPRPRPALPARRLRAPDIIHSRSPAPAPSLPNSDSPRPRAAGPAPREVAGGAEPSWTNRCDFLSREPRPTPPFPAMKGAGRRGLAAGAHWLCAERLRPRADLLDQPRRSVWGSCLFGCHSR